MSLENNQKSEKGIINISFLKKNKNELIADEKSMKTFIIMTLCAICTFGSVDAQETKKKRERKKVAFHVTELTSKESEKEIQNNMTGEQGVFMLMTMLNRNLIEVTYYPDMTTEEELTSTLTELGFTAKVVVIERSTSDSCCGGAPKDSIE